VSSIITEVSSFLRAHRPAPDPERLLAMEIVDAMRDAAPGTRASYVAARFGMSPRTLQRLFIKHVGVTPKHVLQRFRRQRAVDQLSEETGANLARLAAELGYCDQAHLARDFRATLGRSPSAVAASR
jgi:transcriptional regulator GlxA family with amidase domain